MACSSKLTYLDSLLHPENAPVSIPDDVMRRHHLRQETITYNIRSPASQKGLFVLFPNSPTEFIGTHYIWDDVVKRYLFDQNITTAQVLRDSYNYGRKVSGILYLRSSTLPAGVYALNGTFNGAVYEGFPSEVGLQPYDKLLQITSNPLEKIGNVLVGDGIALLSLPQSFDQPFYRLLDPSPATDARTYHNIIDASQNLVYDFSNTEVDFDPEKPETAKTLCQGNVDCLAGGLINTSVSINYTVRGTPPEGATAKFYLRVYLFGLDGNQIEYYDVDTVLDPFDDSANITGTWVYPEKLTTSEYNPPLGGIKLEGSFALTGTVEFSGIKVDYASLGFISFSVSHPGVLSPTALIAYENVAKDTVITLSGVSNYELIPNPDLARNVPTSYGDIDPKGMERIKVVLSKRDELGIRSLWRIPDYQTSLSKLEEISKRKPDMEVARAFGIGDILGKIGDILGPIGNAIIPGAGDVIQTIGHGIGGVFSAGGVPITYAGRYPRAGAAGGVPIEYDNRTPLLNRKGLFARASDEEIPQWSPTKMSCDPQGPECDTEDMCLHCARRVLTELLELTKELEEHMPPCDPNCRRCNVIANASDNAILSPQEGGTENTSADPLEFPLMPPGPQQPFTNTSINVGPRSNIKRGVVFPTVITPTESLTSLGTEPYIAVAGDHPELLELPARETTTKTANGKTIRGYSMQVCPLRPNEDITLIPISAFSKRKFTINHSGVPVQGTSCWAAIGVLDKIQHSIPPFAITGATDPQGRILPNLALPVKAAGMHESGIKLAANSPYADYPVVTTRQAATLAKDLEAGIAHLQTAYPSAKRSVPKLPGKTVAWAADVEPYTEIEQRIIDTARMIDNEEAAIAEDEIIADFDRAAARMMRLKPEYDREFRLMMDLEELGLVDALHHYLQADPTGYSLKQFLLNSTPVPGSKAGRRRPAEVRAGYTRGPTQAEAQANRARTVTERANQTGFPADEDWIIRNGYRGPSAEQMAYFKATGNLPEPGAEPTGFSTEQLRRNKEERKIEGITRSVYRGSATPEQLDTIREFVRSHGGRGPTQDEIRELLEAAGYARKGGTRAARVTGTIERFQPIPEQNRMLGRGNRLGRYAKYMEQGDLV